MVASHDHVIYIIINRSTLNNHNEDNVLMTSVSLEAIYILFFSYFQMEVISQYITYMQNYKPNNDFLH